MTDKNVNPPFDLDQIDGVLTTTRSVRKRLDLDRSVEQQVLLDCLDIAQQAPTASNSQQWHWVVVTDSGIRGQIAEVYRRSSADYFAAREKSGAGDSDQNKRVRSSSVYLRDELHRVPALVIPCAAGDPARMPLGQQAAFYASIVPATWSFMLALRARGLGSVYTTLHLPGAAEVAEILQIPAGYTQTGLIPVAYTVGTDFRPAQRPDVREIVSFDRW